MVDRSAKKRQENEQDRPSDECQRRQGEEGSFGGYQLIVPTDQAIASILVAITAFFPPTGDC